MAHIKVSLLLVVSFVLAIHAGIITSSDESVDRETFVGTLQYNCRRKTGNDEAFNRIQNSGATLANCMINKLDFATLLSAGQSLTRWNRAKFFATQCSVVRVVLTCSDLLKPDINKCLNQDVIEFADNWDGAAKEAFSFACKDNGKLFVDNDGSLLKCVDNPMQLLASCPREKSYLEPVAKQCNDMVEWRTCLQAKLSQCNDPRLTELLDIYFRPLAEGGFCRKYISMDGNTTSIIEAK